MKWLNIYLLGYLIFLGGVVAAMWKLKIIEQIGAGWTIIGLVIAIGLGIMIGVGTAGSKGDIQINK
ncbi:MAG TPA: hypothetical protein VFE84_14775 [Patescibacteria group bacterium]|jgi:hypothetical protein|nr:hypothetical protein [Patescibacteria group bacterium]